MPEEKQKDPGEQEKQSAEQEVSDEKEGGIFAGKKVSKDKYLKALEEIEKANSDRDHWKNEYYRAYADISNLRKSLEEEKRTALRYRSEGFLEKLLPALDAFRMALVASPESQEAKNYQIGFQYIYKQLQGALEEEGVSELTPKVNEPYDISYMHAVDSEVNDDLPPNTVTKVYSAGYKLHDRLIRPAMVGVSKKSPVEEPKKEENEDGKAA
jgi:molecular chaperone GrpE